MLNDPQSDIKSHDFALNGHLACERLPLVAVDVEQWTRRVL